MEANFMNVKEIISEWCSAKEKIAIWGTSAHAQKIMRRWICELQITVCCIYDNLANQDELLIEGKRIPVRRIGTYGKEYAGEKIILCATYADAKEDIANQLKKLGLREYMDYVDGEIIENTKNPPGRTYERVTPGASYAPWRGDAIFSDVLKNALPYTMVDIYRCWSLWLLVSQSAKCDTGDLVEIGVWRGGTGLVIAKAMENANIDAHLYLCDTFCGVPKAGPHDGNYHGGEHADTSPDIVKELLCKHQVHTASILQGIFPEEVMDVFQHLTFRFVHVDVDVYQSGKDIVQFILPRMTPGGIIVFDDYGSRTTDGITALVEELADAENRLICITNLNGQATFVRL